MNDVDGPAGVPGGVWQPANDDVPRPARGHVQREQAFQLQVVLFLDRVILPPYWVTAICHENELSDNARARARARGVQPGVPDLYVCQSPGGRAGGPRTLWLELKWGSNKPSDAQEHVARRLIECCVPCGTAWRMTDVLVALHHAGIRLHENAANLADEYQHRAEAAVLKAEQRVPRGTTPRKRTGKPSLRALRMAATRLGL
jgi:hypothetical protein